uniref:C2H2-type domain-containing protein n=1 Tax=Stomoxys calcitrans TaxID=35570 RepID=A0A1I8PB45_STOCA
MDETISQWMPLLKCDICKLLVSNYTRLEEHFLYGHQMEKCYIICCNRKLTQRVMIEEHIRRIHCDGLPKDISLRGTPVNVNTQEMLEFVHHYMPWIKCDLCGCAVTQYEKLKKHFRLHHPYENFHILCCQRKFSRLYSIAEHIRVHISLGSYQCHICNKLHLSRSYLHYHLMETHSINLYPTTKHFNLAITAKANSAIARTSFADLDDFIAMFRGKLDCYICSEKYITFTTLQIHFSAKHPDRFFYVMCCGKIFRTRNDLEEHIHLHLNPQGFKCDICKMYFIKRSLLFSHYRTRHPYSRTDAVREVQQNSSGNIDKLISAWQTSVKCESTIMLGEEDIAINYPVYFVAGAESMTLDEIENSITQMETIDIEAGSSDEEISLSDFDVVLESETPLDAIEPELETTISIATDDTGDHASINGQLNLRKRGRGYYTSSEGIRYTEREMDETISQWMPLLKCDICKLLVSNYTRLEEHFLYGHQMEKCYIICCNRKLTQRVMIEEHIRRIHCDGLPKDISLRGTPVNVNTQEMLEFVHHYMPWIKCDLCGCAVTQYEKLKKHFRLHHPYENFHILCCQRKFSRLYSIAEHIRVHISLGSYQCHICNKLHLSRSYLHYHLMETHSINLYPTTKHFNLAITAKANSAIARTSFADLDDFIAMFRGKLDCYICSEKYITFTTLQIHFSAKHPDRFFYVMCCGKIFRTRNDLEEHIHLHLNPQGFKCDICKMYFIKRSLLFSHYRTRHPYSRTDAVREVQQNSSGNIDKLISAWQTSVKCGECNMRFKKYTSLEEHFARDHADESCRYCKYSTTNNLEFWDHVHEAHPAQTKVLPPQESLNSTLCNLVQNIQ